METSRKRKTKSYSKFNEYKKEGIQERYFNQLENKLIHDGKFRAKFVETKEAIRNIEDLRYYHDKRRILEITMFCFAMIGIVLTLIENHDELFTYEKYARLINMAITFLLLLTIIFRYYIQKKILILQNKIPKNIYIFQIRSLFLSFIAECIICSICIPPGLHGYFSIWEWRAFALDGQCPLDQSIIKADRVLINGNCYLHYKYHYRVIGIFSLFRLYMIPRMVRNLSGFYSHRIAFVGTLNNVDALGPMFAVKCLLRINPFACLLPCFLLTLWCTSYAVMVLERPVNPGFQTLINSLWCTVISMSTVGYGDRVPATFSGRLFMIFGGILAGILLISMLGAAFFALLEINDNDKTVLHVLYLENWTKNMYNESATLIQAAWNMRKCYKLGFPQTRPILYRNAEAELSLHVNRVHSLRKNVPQKSLNTSQLLEQVYISSLELLRNAHRIRVKRLQEINKKLTNIIQTIDQQTKRTKTNY